MSKTKEAPGPAPSFTLDATDPLTAGLVRYWIGAARAHGGYSPSAILNAEVTLVKIQEYRQKVGRRR